MTKLPNQMHLIKRSLTSSTARRTYKFYDLVLETPQHPSEPLESALMKSSELKQLKLHTKTTFEGKYSIDVDPKERLKEIFGATLTGEARQSSSRLQRGEPRKIAGILVPDRPPEPDNCCMSGCINCVWELYKDDIKEWNDKRNEAAHKINESASEFIWPKDFHPPLKVLKPEHVPEELRKTAQHKKATKPDDNMWGNVPVAIRVFADTEKRIKAKKRAQAEAQVQEHSVSAQV